ncbi:hypothetical protein [Clostridium sp.]|uniref:hypothetical protein n=1 Tax=Clostridium sp. TaxID=1506 RepID=UPI002634320C|nr:hypothetical protein [Clostridium sp.]
MGKPSIFSREYQKKMRRRRRNILVTSIVVILVISALAIKVIYYPIDFSNIKKNIQAWIDSDNTAISEKSEVEQKESVNDGTINKEEAKEESQKPAEEYLNITLASGNAAKAIYINDTNSGKIFKTLDSPDKDVSFDISPSGKQMIIEDKNSVITLYNVDDGTNKIVSKDQYVSTSGSVFTKEATMQTQLQYLWNANPKFINEDNMIFVSNRPYFGSSATKQYLWMTNVKTNEDKIFWELSGTNIQIGTREEKGIKVTVDGKIYYIDVNGNYIQ